MLFRKKIERCCAYCLHGSPLDDESVICKKHGVVERWGKCRGFHYDPLKREPDSREAVFGTDFDESDFEF